MRSLILRVFPTVSGVLYLLGVVRPVQAQSVHVVRTEETATGFVLEVEPHWQRGLREAADSAHVTQFDLSGLLGLTDGVVTASENVKLPSLVSPRLRVLASEYDEIPLPAAPGADTLLAALEGPLVEVVGLGYERKVPTGTVLVRLISYDPDVGVLRRYRKVRVRVDAAQGGADRNASVSVFGKSTAATDPHLAVTRSVLADGYLFKIPVREEGVYRIDRALLESLLGQVGLSVAGIEPADIRVYGNGGAPLPALNSAPRPADLREVPVTVNVDGTGAFSGLVFYGNGPSGWGYDAVQGEWEHYVNPFSSTNYYFLKIDTESEKAARVPNVPFPGYADAQRFASVTGRVFKDFDEVLWSKEEPSGYTWVSRQIRPAETLDALGGVSVPGLTSGPVTYRARVAIRANPRATAVFRSGGTEVGRLSAPAVSNSIYDPVARTAEAAFTGTASSGDALALDMGVDALGSGTIEPQAALDWVRAFYTQTLRAQGGYLRFATPAGQTGRQEFVLSGFSQAPTVWDVTDGNAIRKLEIRAEGAAYVVQVDVSSTDLPRELVAFTGEAERSVSGVERVGNQNLHGIQAYPDFVIVVPDTFRTYAENLADMRRSDGLTVEVAGVEQIYNEFSGGVPDMRAVRDYFRFLYDRAPDANHLLRYALLFGDGDYNFRHLGAQEGDVLRNWIFPYETEDSFDEDRSFTSDDYFGLLDDSEGLWTYNGPTAVSQERVDIGIGRFPVQTVEDAQNAVAKIKHYEGPASLGAWRTRYVFAADDAFNGLAGNIDENDLHTQNADVVAEALHAQSPEINIRKIYAISYDRVYTGGEWHIPVAKADIMSALEEGTIAFNYSGHGSPESLAQEKLFTREDVSTLDNLDRLPLFITATCSFGRWDMAEKQSTAEDLFNSANGGAIALLTTVRTVFTYADPFSLNLGLNRQLNLDLFERDEAGLPRRVGDALRATKNTPVGLEGNNRKFNLLGDPTMRIGVPSGKAVVTAVNGASVDTMAAPLRALDHISVAGEVHTPSGQVDDSFSGTVQLTVYDAARRVPVQQQQYLNKPYYRVQEDLIWRGEVTASAGRYQAEFVVPKDISYANEPGRIAVYAGASGMHQAIGYTDNVRVGGSVEPPDDHEGPKLQLFLNDTTFVSGGLTHPRPDLIVKLFDESGVNTVGAGVGHELQLVLDGQDASAVNLSGRYRSEGNSYQKGTIEYPLEEYLAGQDGETLSPGPHLLKVKAWDVLNNSTTGTLDFYVSSGEDLALRNVFNYPNPMVDATRFVFEHNQPGGTPADVQVRIYTLSGRPVRTIESDEALPGGVLPGGPVQIPWDGRDDDLDRLATGIYLYKLRVRIETPDGERQVAEQIEKIALIR